MNIDSLRTAVVGCGYHGTALAEAVVRSEHLHLVACADPDATATATVVAAHHDIGSHASIEELLDVEDVDAVLIATPHDELARTALTAIRAGRHVMIEKPMALDEEQAKQVELAAASAGVTCMVGYSFRYGMAQHLQRLIARGAIGDPLAISGSIGTGSMDEGWIASEDAGGGPLLYVGCHWIDLALWLMGDDPTGVSAHVQQRADSGVDETSAITLAFSRGRLAQLLVTQKAPGFFYDLKIIGTSGFIGLRGRNFVQFQVDVHSETLPEYRDPTTIQPTMQRDHITMMLMPELAEFAAAITEHREPAITAADGRRVLRVVDAVRHSSPAQHPAVLDGYSPGTPKSVRGTANR